MKAFLACIAVSVNCLATHGQQQRDLDYFISRGLLANPQLNDLKNQAFAASLDSQRVRALYKVQINALGNNVYAPVVSGWGYDKAISNGGQYNNVVTFSRMLASRASIQNQLQAAALNRLSASNTGSISEQDLKLAITAQYITAYGDQQQISFNRAVLDLLKTESGILKRLTDRGTYRQTDYLTLWVTIQQQQIVIDQLMVQYQKNYALLNSLCGIQDTAFAVLAPPSLEPLVLPPIRQTVFFRKFQLDSLQLENSLDQIKFAYRPKFSLYADAGINSTLTAAPYRNFGGSVGLLFSLIIYDGKQRRIQQNRIRLREHTRSGYQQFFVQQAGQQLGQWVQQLTGMEKLIAQIETQLTFSQGLIEANRKLLVTGDVRIADYIIAINNYLNARNLITQNTVNRYQVLNQLNYWNR